MYQILVTLMIIWPFAAGQNISDITVIKNTAILPLTYGAACDSHVRSSNGTYRNRMNPAAQSGFVIFDDGFFPVMGTTPTLERIASVSHDLIGSPYALTPIQGTGGLLVVFQDGTVIWPTFGNNKLDDVSLHLPIRSLSGATSHNGITYITTNDPDIPMVATLDVEELTVTPMINNYQGHRFAKLKSIITTRNGDLVFADTSGTPDWIDGSHSRLPPALYLFNTSSQTTIALANNFVDGIAGLALSPDENSIYVVGNLGHNQIMGPKSIYAFDFDGHFTSGLRLVYQTGGVLTGDIAVSSAGVLFAASTSGLDVVDPSRGVLLGKVKADAGPIKSVAHDAETGMLYIGGRENIYRSRLVECGQ